MSEIRTVTTLRSKRDEIIASIKLYEDRIKQARADLAHVNACIKIFEASGDVETMPKYVDVYRLFKRGEAMITCKEALASGPRSTRELALAVMDSQGARHGRQGAGESGRRSVDPSASDAGQSRENHPGWKKRNRPCVAAPIIPSMRTRKVRLVCFLGLIANKIIYEAEFAELRNRRLRASRHLLAREGARRGGVRRKDMRVKISPLTSWLTSEGSVLHKSFGHLCKTAILAGQHLFHIL